MNNLHQYLQPQLESIIDDLISKGYTLPELTLTGDWQRETPFRDMKLRFNQAFLTLDDWITLHGLIDGDYRPFKANLELQITTTIEARWEIHMRLKQEDYMANYEPMLEVAV